MVTSQQVNIMVEDMEGVIDKAFTKEAIYWWGRFTNPCPMMYPEYLRNYLILRWNDFTRLN